MFLKKALCISIALLLIAWGGCGQKKQEPKKSGLAEMPELATTETKKDTGDIFDEFYEDDKSKEERKETKSSFDDDFSTPSSGTTEFIPDGRYVVQVSCVASSRLADRVKADLEAKGWPAYVAEVENPTPDLMGTYYRIRIGGFNMITPAREFGVTQLQPAGYEFWIDNRSNDNVGMSGYGLGESDVGEYGSSMPAASTPAPEPEPQTWGGSQESWSEPATTVPAPAKPEPEPPAPEPAPAAAEPSPPAQPAPAAEPSPAPATEPEKPAAPEPENAEPAPAEEPAPAAETESAPAQEPAEKPAPADDWGDADDDWGDDSDW